MALYYLILILYNYFFPTLYYQYSLLFLRECILLILNINNPPVVVFDHHFLSFTLFFLFLCMYASMNLFIFSHVIHWKTITIPVLCCRKERAYLRSFPQPISELWHPGLTYPELPFNDTSGQTPSVSQGASYTVLCSSDTAVFPSVLGQLQIWSEGISNRLASLPSCNLLVIYII